MARRRRYNHKRRRGSLSFLYKLLAFVLICTAISLALTLFFRIRSIEVSGNDRYTRQEIIDAAGVNEGDNMFLMNKYSAAERIRRALPYIETVQFRRVLPSKLVVQITECRDPVAIKQDGTVYLLCDRGNIVDTVSAAKWSQYIQIEGLTLLNPQVGSEARASATQQAVLDQLLSMLVLLDDKGMLHEVQVIDLSDAARITMQYMGRFQVEFLWDADFNYKLDYLAAVVEKLEANEKGTIDMTQDGKASFIPS
jgi:cell division protein FtsQ